MKIIFESSNVEKYFSDFNLLKKDKGKELAIKIKLRINQLKAANNLYIYISIQD